MVTFCCERKTGAEMPKKIPQCVGKNPGQVRFSTGRIFSRAATLSFVSIAQHVSKRDADKDASREQIRPVKKSFT
jgi:hypothetical protein